MYDVSGKKLEIGDRAIIVKSVSGNEGRICQVTDYFNPITTTYMGRRINLECTVIITSLGSPLISKHVGSAMTGPMCPRWLRKLPTVDEPELQLESVLTE
jgi:hypothetical protein